MQQVLERKTSPDLFEYSLPKHRKSPRRDSETLGGVILKERRDSPSINKSDLVPKCRFGRVVSSIPIPSPNRSRPQTYCQFRPKSRSKTLNDRNVSRLSMKWRISETEEPTFHPTECLNTVKLFHYFCFGNRVTYHRSSRCFIKR